MYNVRSTKLLKTSILYENRSELEVDINGCGPKKKTNLEKNNLKLKYGFSQKCDFNDLILIL